MGQCRSNFKNVATPLRDYRLIMKSEHRHDNELVFLFLAVRGHGFSTRLDSFKTWYRQMMGGMEAKWQDHRGFELRFPSGWRGYLYFVLVCNTGAASLQPIHASWCKTPMHHSDVNANVGEQQSQFRTVYWMLACGFDRQPSFKCTCFLGLR